MTAWRFLGCGLLDEYCRHSAPTRAACEYKVGVKPCAPRRSLVSRASAASALARAERDTGPSVRIAKRNIGLNAAQVRWPLGPGSRFARPGHESARVAPHP